MLKSPCGKGVFLGCLLLASVTASAADFTVDPLQRKVHGLYKINIESVRPEWNHFWFTLPPTLSYQTPTGVPRFSVPPTRVYRESKFGNQVAYWDFTDGKSLDLSIEFDLLVRNVLQSIDPAQIQPYDTDSPEYQLYTRDERMTRVNAVVKSIHDQLAGRLEPNPNPYLVAREAFQWTLDHVAYATMDQLHRERGVDPMTAVPFEHAGRTYFKGDCGEYTWLFNSILRSFGVPARMATGGWSLGQNQWHVWSEVLFPGFGWVPVDTSAADVFVYDEGADWNSLGEKQIGTFPQIKTPWFYFGQLDPYRFVVSVGTEIPLDPVVDWDFASIGSGYFYQHGEAAFMQFGLFHWKQNMKEFGITFSDLSND
jgi:transglutaminase-like putative cysteine protease